MDEGGRKKSKFIVHLYVHLLSFQINLEMGEAISVLRNLSLGSLSFFKIYSKLKISLVPPIFVVVLFLRLYFLLLYFIQAL